MNNPKKIPIAIVLFCFGVFLTLLYPLMNTEKASLNDQVRSSLDESFIALPLGVVHYEISGPENGPVVVLIHGFSVPGYIWDPTFEYLVSQGFRVLRYDLYGRGTSDRPEEATYNLALYVTQLQQLLNALDIKTPIHVVGLSYGGPISAAYARQYPGEIHSVTLIDPQTSPVYRKDIFPLNLPLVGEYLMGVFIAPSVLPKSQANDFYRPENYPGWEELYREQLKYKGFKAAILDSIRQTVHIDAISEYEAIGEQSFPVLLIWGKEDQTIPYSDIELIHQSIPRLEFHAILEAGHLPHYEQPQVVNPILVEFLDRNTP